MAVACYLACLSLPALGKGHLSRMKGYEARQRYQERARLAVECSAGPEEWGDALARQCGVTRADLDALTRLRWLAWCQAYTATADLLSLDWLDLMGSPSIDTILTAADIARGWLFDLSRAAKAAKASA